MAADYLSPMQSRAGRLPILGLAIILATGCAGSRSAHRSTAFHTGYAYAFIATKAERLQDENYYKALKRWKKARRHYVKGYETGMTRLEARHPGISAGLDKNPGEALPVTTKDDVPLLYWTAAALGASIGLSKDRPEWILRLPQLGSMLFRVTELDPGYSSGAAWQLLMVYEASRPAMMGGSVALAKHYYEEALKYGGESNAGLYVAYGESISVQEQDKETFVGMMERALAIKGGGVVNRIARKRARWLLGRIDELFI